MKSNALSLFPRLEKSADKFDIVFMDPPYHKGMAKKSLINADNYDILSAVGLVIIEHFKKDDLPLDLKSLVFDKERRYGDTLISIYRKIDEKP
jgi:16S rRNA G966 N2-methylase RsmD